MAARWHCRASSLPCSKTTRAPMAFAFRRLLFLIPGLISSTEMGEMNTTDTNDTFTIRAGRKEDLPRVLELVRELAVYERAPDEVTNTVAMMEEDGLGPNPVYGMYVAGRNDIIFGVSVYYYPVYAGTGSSASL